MCGDLADQRDVFFFCLAVISYANSTCKVKTGEDVDDLVPPKFLSPRELCLVLSSRPSPIDERLLASNLGISFFPSYRFGVAVKENSIVLETYPSTQRIKFPRGKLPREK